jgi:hypothetical protein
MARSVATAAYRHCHVCMQCHVPCAMLHDWHRASQRSSMQRCGTGQPPLALLALALLGKVATNETELLLMLLLLLVDGSVTRSHMGQTPASVAVLDSVQVEVDALEDVDDAETVGRPNKDRRSGGGLGSLLSLLSSTVVVIVVIVAVVVAVVDSIIGGCNCGCDSDNSKPAESAVNHVSRSLCVLVQQ